VVEATTSKLEDKSVEVKETETRSAASTPSQPVSKKMAAIAAKRQEKKESAKEARIAAREASKEEAKESSGDKGDASVTAPKPAITTTTRTPKIIDLRKDPTKERPPMTAKNTKVLTAFVKPGKTPSANKILGMVPGSPASWEDKAKLMHQQGVTSLKNTSNTNSSSSTPAATSSPVKDKVVKEKEKEKEKAKKDIEVNMKLLLCSIVYIVTCYQKLLCDTTIVLYIVL